MSKNFPRVSKWIIFRRVLALLFIGIIGLSCSENSEETNGSPKPLPESRITLPEFYGFFAVDGGNTIGLDKDSQPPNVSEKVEFILHDQDIAAFRGKWQVSGSKLNGEKWEKIPAVKCRIKPVTDNAMMIRVVPANILPPGVYEIELVGPNQIKSKFVVEGERIIANSTTEEIIAASKKWRLEGAFTGAQGQLIHVLRFEPGNKVFYKSNGGWQAPNTWSDEIEGQYKVEGTEIILSDNIRGHVGKPLTIQENGTLRGYFATFINPEAVVKALPKSESEMTEEFGKYKQRAFDSDAKANLHNIFLACKAFWADTDSNQQCNLFIAKGGNYGYVQSSSVKVFIKQFTEDDFEVYAKHEDSPNTWKINATADIAGVTGLNFPE